MTYKAFKNWALTTPAATLADAVKKFPKIHPLQLVAWFSRLAAEKEYAK